ncbi:MAG: PRD domain-containing protein [Anaerococcus sp.]|nr:PRD domain-containing protein [Anaerococcus sp.]
MNKRQLRLIDLLKDNKWLTGNELAEILKVSTRTIRNDIKKINDESGDDVIRASKKFGYKLKQDLININIRNPKQNNRNLKSLILMDLLKTHKKIYYSNLIDKYYISDSTLNAIISEINKDIKKINSASIKKKGDLIYLDGSELSVRMIYKDLLFKESKNNIFNLNELAENYKKFDLIKIKENFENILSYYDYKVDQAYFPILILHIGVSLDRLLSGNPASLTSKEESEIKELKNSDEFKIASDFLNLIKDYYNIDIPMAEVYILTINIINKKIIDKGLLTLDDNLLDLIKKSLLYVDFMTGINLSLDKNLIDNLYVHLKSLLVRLDNKITINKLYYEDIKSTYPYIFELALIASSFLQKSLCIEIPEEEVTFIALHLGNSYRNNYNNKYKAVLILPKTRAISSSMFEKINRTFSHELEIVGVYNYFEESLIKDAGVDMIISSVRISHNLQIPTIYCSVFFSKDDEVSIFTAIRELEENKLKLDYSNHLKKLLDKEHFYQDLRFKNKYKVLEFLCKNLLKKGEVDESYHEKVLERESFSSTSFAQGFAIPHSYEPSGIKKSSISILLLEEPILRDKYQVSIVFLLTIRREDSPILKLFFSWMDKICKDISKFAQVTSSIDFNEFINNFDPGD